MPDRHRRSLASPPRLARGAILAAAVLFAGSAPGAMMPGGALAASPPDVPAGGLQPSIQYEDAIAHAGDRIDFTPGDRVTVPFEPSSGDRWLVGGVAPRALPAGRLSGRSMRDIVPVDLKAPDGGPQATATPTGEPGGPPTPTSDPTATPDPTTAPSPTDSAEPDPGVDAPIVPPGDIVPAGPALWSFADADTAVEPAAVVNAGGLRREIFGFLPYWELTASSTRLDWEKLSTIAFFGVGASSAGDLVKTRSSGATTVGWSGWTSSKMTSVINTAHANHTRVVLTVQSFAWTSSQLASQKALLGSSTARLNLARQIAAAVRDRGADGANLDFEPIASGYDDEFTALVRSVRSELDKVAKGYQLTFDATGYIGNYPIEEATASGGADAVFIMGYDYRSSGSSPVGSVAPIGGPLYDVGDTVRAYAARVSPSKLILGVPYYGRAWSTTTSALNSKNQSGAKYGASATATYETARTLAAENGRRYDSVEGVAWTVYRRETCTTAYGCVTSWRQLYYEDATSLKAKYDLVNSYDLRGAGIWALGYDGTRTELYTAIKDKFITDSIPPVIKSATISTTALSPNGDGRVDTVKVVMSATGYDHWGWIVEPMSGSTPGAPIRTGSSTIASIAYTWNGLLNDGSPAPDGRYRVTVWTADASNNRAQRQFNVTVDTRAPTLGVTAGPTSISPNGDRQWDTAALRWTSTERLTATGRIIDRNGATVRYLPISPGTAGSTVWDGRDRYGKVVADGHYRYRVGGTDDAGNGALRDAAVDVDRTIRSVSWSASSFDPRAGKRSQLAFTLSRPATVTVKIYLGSTEIRSIWTKRASQAGTYRWNWDGKTSTGAYAPPGSYRVRFTATSWIGVSLYARAINVLAH